MEKQEPAIAKEHRVLWSQMPCTHAHPPFTCCSLFFLSLFSLPSLLQPSEVTGWPHSQPDACGLSGSACGASSCWSLSAPPPTLQQRWFFATGFAMVSGTVHGSMNYLELNDVSAPPGVFCMVDTARWLS